MKLSIITVNYNNKAGLQKTIDSVICQTWRDFEWIIIDGGSTDGSKELIEQYQQHFAYWCSEPDKGVYHAMNKGIAKAKGEYMNFLNSGDCFYESGTLNKVFQQPPMSDVVYGDCMGINKQITSLWEFPSEVDYAYFFCRNICHQAMFVRSSVLKTEGYDESYKVYGDWTRWLKLAIEGGSFQHISCIVCYYEFGGLSNSCPDQSKEYSKMINELPISTFLKEFIISSKERKDRLYDYEECCLTRDTLILVKERPLFSKIIHLNILLIKMMKFFLSILHL